MSFWGWPLPTTPMAMKMGISWIVYTIVCAKRKSRCSVRTCVISFLPLRLDRWGGKGAGRRDLGTRLVTQTTPELHCVPVQGRPGSRAPVQCLATAVSGPGLPRSAGLSYSPPPKLVHERPGPQSVSLSNNVQMVETTLKVPLGWLPGHPPLHSQVGCVLPKSTPGPGAYEQSSISAKRWRFPKAPGLRLNLK